MFRRWLIRGVLLFLLALFVVGWGVSTVRWMRCRYGHDEKLVACNVTYGEVCFAWQRGWDVAGGWDADCVSAPFRIVDNFFWGHASSTEPDHTEWLLRCMGFGYYQHADGLLSGPRLEAHTVSIPFWFLIVGTGAGLVWAWRKTRAKLDPRTAFPVQMPGGSVPWNRDR